MPGGDVALCPARWLSSSLETSANGKVRSGYCRVPRRLDDPQPDRCESSPQWRDVHWDVGQRLGLLYVVGYQSLERVVAILLELTLDEI